MEYYLPRGWTIAVILRCRLSKSPRTRFALCSPVWPFHSSNLRCLDLYCDRLSPQGGDGGTVCPPLILDIFPQLCSIHRRPLMHRLVWRQDFGNLQYFHTNLLRSNYTPIPVFSPCFNVTLAHCIDHTNVTSGFDHWVALFKMSQF